jgi:pyruvate dehydrogenase E2 component (dihydrolipoamide acetyltransferase)
MRERVARVRSGGLRSSDVAEATITVTNLGDQGATTVFGVIVPPQAAIVGLGRVVERPWAVDGMLTVRKVVTVSLSADHRASHGHRGSRFLRSFARALENPEVLA